jgi:Flp pilus assembly pilin Flp
MFTLTRFLCDESAATAVEYSMLAGGVALAIVGTMQGLSLGVRAHYLSVAQAFK